MNLAQRQAQAIQQLNSLPGWYNKFNHLIAISHNLPPMSAILLTSANRIGGCQSVTYVAAEVREGRLYIYGCSNSIIIKGIIAFAHSIFNGYTIEELKATPINFHAETGLINQLTAARQGFLWQLVNKLKAHQ